MDVCKDLTDVLEGRTPERTPVFIYDWLLGFVWKPFEPPPDWEAFIDRGLGVLEHATTVDHVQHGVEKSIEEERKGNKTFKITRLKTPVGTVQHVSANGWDVEFPIKSPRDYRTYQWITENTEVKPCHDRYNVLEEKAGKNCFPMVIGTQTPAMTINLSLVGTEQFCLDLGNELPELFDLHEAMRRLHLEEVKLVAAGPGRYVKWIENVTVSMLGPKWHEELLMPVYRECVPILEAADKRLLVHYDGELRPIADQIADAPFHVVEGFTEPPEGDMLFSEGRAAWPDKVLWGNINIGMFDLSEEDLRAELIAKRERAGKRAFAFEIAEDLPRNWRKSVPVVLDTLAELD